MQLNIKKYYLLPVLAILAAGSITSCKKFLEEKQVSTLTQTYYESETGLNALINGLYVISRVKHEWDANGSKLIEPETDQYMHVNLNFARVTVPAYGNSTSTIAAQNMTNFIGAANASYAPMGTFPHINNCNIALDIIDNLKPGRYGSDETFRKTRRSEILFLRAWAYYLISNQLGDVPLLLTARRSDNGVYYFPKSKLEDIYKQLLSDLRYSFDNLPATVDYGRISKYAAGHLLAKLYLNRAQASGFNASSETHLKMLYKGNVATDLDSAIYYSTAVINGKGGAAGLAADYWSLFNPAVSESAPSTEVIWSGQFSTNTSLNGRFGGNRSVNYHTGNYSTNTGVRPSMSYGSQSQVLYKPTDWGYDNFRDKVNDSRYYKTFQYEYVSNMPVASSTSYSWSAAAAAWWNANKPAGEPAVTAGSKRILEGRRALIYLENQKSEALDSTMVMSMPFQFLVRWIRSSVTGRYYYRLYVDGTNMGLVTNRVNIYLSSKKFVDPTRGGSADESNFGSEAGTRDPILMRLAETFLIRAEAYGRQGQYGMALNDINVVRQRAAYKGGETRPRVLVEWEPQASGLADNEKVAPYTASGASATRMLATENHFTPGTSEATAEGYIPTASSKADMFIHFIYNEKAREFLSEGLAWEDLHNAGILYDRVVYLNQVASDKSGLWPTAYNVENGNGQDGNGKGLMRKHYTFRPWPYNYLVQLTDADGKVLDAQAQAAYQNPGY